MTTTTNPPAATGEDAELIHAARTLTTRLDQAIRHAGTVFALALAATIAAMKADLPTLAAITALTALATLAAVLLAVLARVALGDPPDDAPPTPGEVVAGPATSSGATTRKNRVILRK